MILFATLLARFGLPDALTKKFEPSTALAAVLAFLGLLWGAVQQWGYFDDSDRAGQLGLGLCRKRPVGKRPKAGRSRPPY